MPRKKMTVRSVAKEMFEPTSVENNRRAFSRWQRFTRDEHIEFAKWQRKFEEKNKGRLR